MSNRSLAEYYNNKVEEITIKYKITLVWFHIKKIDEGVLCIKKAEAADFYLKCPNEECTEGYIDLRNHVDDAIRNQLTSAHGVTTCCGKTAPDHPNQNCES